jgi:hypothetical protein
LSSTPNVLLSSGKNRASRLAFLDDVLQVIPVRG